jgi:hypothetical protein
LKTEHAVGRQRFDAEVMEEKAGEVAGILRALANERRVMILCKLLESGEANVNTLAFRSARCFRTGRASSRG